MPWFSSNKSNSAPPPSYAQSMSQPPTKFVKMPDGRTCISDEYKAWKARQGQPVTTAHPDAIPVVTNMDELEQLDAASVKAGAGIVRAAPAMDDTREMLQDSDVAKSIGLRSDQTLDALGAVFQKYEIPIGLSNKLLGLDERFDALEFIVDDSGSMGNPSDTTNPRPVHGQKPTRWQEAHVRIREMLEVVSVVPTPSIVLRFLNRGGGRIVRQWRHHPGEPPHVWLQTVLRDVDAAFADPPTGGTPMCEVLEQSFGQGGRIARYILGDGVPNGGPAAIDRIVRLVRTRGTPACPLEAARSAAPHDNPITFMSCSDTDEDVEWMKTCEEQAPFCAEYDDHGDEGREVAQDQGKAFPYTAGFHLICQWVGAQNPHDLDAMDESIPMTRWTLSYLMGFEMSDADYRRYWTGFIEAQVSRKQKQSNHRPSQLDTLKNTWNWEPTYGEFASPNQVVAQSLAAVQEFRRRVEACVN